MTQKSPTTSLTVEQRLNRETAKINWPEIQRFFAQGRVILVHAEQDLVRIGAHFVRDEVEVIQTLLHEEAIRIAEIKDAESWEGRQITLWAVVVAPWILVQENS